MSSLRLWMILVGLGICSSLYGQGKWGIRLNQNTDFFRSTEHEVRAGRISAAVSYLKGKYTHELELFLPTVDGSSPTFPWSYRIRFPDNKYSSYSFRYTTSRDVYSIKWFSASLGVGLNGYFLKIVRVPGASTSFPVTDSMIGASLNATPGFNVHASKHLSFVLDCPLKVFDFYHETVNIRNPAIPVRQQKERSFETDFFMRAFTVRVGVAYRFG